MHRQVDTEEWSRNARSLMAKLPEGATLTITRGGKPTMVVVQRHEPELAQIDPEEAEDFASEPVLAAGYDAEQSNPYEDWLA